MNRKVFKAVMVALILIPLIMDVLAAPVTSNSPSEILYNKDVNYLQMMYDCATRGDAHAMELGKICEAQRNIKIDDLNLGHNKSYYFNICSTGDEVLQAMKIDRLKIEHHTAGQVYECLNRYGYTDSVIAGILGNMMAECGGQTLDLQWWIYGDSGAYYGLCQWCLSYAPDVSGRDVNGQMEYLIETIERNMTIFGGDYKYFISISDAGVAARYFCGYYERGTGGSVRERNAYQAYNWIKINS